eukprot:1538570-Alexandrium_andersonii.AAC.1
MRKALGLKRAPLGLRLVLLDKVVAQVLLWAAETKRPTVLAYRRLRSLQRRMTRIMFPLPRLEGEHVWAWRQRHARIIDGWMQQNALRLWCDQWLIKYWQWGGHWARSCHRPLYKLPDYRSIEWKRAVRASTTRRRAQWT